MDIAITVLQILALVGIGFLAMFKKNYFSKYLEEKARFEIMECLDKTREL